MIRQQTLNHYRTKFAGTIACVQKDQGLRKLDAALALLNGGDRTIQPRNQRTNEDRVSHLTREAISLLRQAQGKTQRGF